MKRRAFTKPPSCCPLMAEYVRKIWDLGGGHGRQRLRPYLERMAQTEAPGLEIERARYLAWWTATVLLPETLAYVGFPRSAQKLRNPDARDWLKVGALISEALKPLREVLEPMEGSMQVHIEKESFAFARSTAADAHAAVRLGHDMESLSPDGDRTDAYSAVGWCRQAAFSSYMAFEAACNGKPAAQTTAAWMDVVLTGLDGLLAVGQEAKSIQAVHDGWRGREDHDPR